MQKLHILSHSALPFTDREESGLLLVKHLSKFFGKKREGVVLGIPRGGVIVANQIAKGLQLELDIVLSRKLGAPFNPELAIGAIGEDGKLFVNEIASQIGVQDSYIEKEKAHQMAEISRRIAIYRKVRPKVALADKVVIVTDDGVATGASMRAALWAIRQENPKKLIVALPVSSSEALKELAKDADELMCLRVPEFFAAVGQFYKKFPQVGDEEVLEILKEAYATLAKK